VRRRAEDAAPTLNGTSRADNFTLTADASQRLEAKTPGVYEINFLSGAVKAANQASAFDRGNYLNKVRGLGLFFPPVTSAQCAEL